MRRQAGPIAGGAGAILIVLAAWACGSHTTGPAAIFTPTALGPTDPEVPNPLRGAYRWSGAETAAQLGPAHDEYRRYTWRELEAGEGDYSGIDRRLEADILAAAAAGRKYAFRVRAMRGLGTGLDVPDGLSAHGWWLDDNTFVPDWNDPVFLDRFRALMAELGRRYDRDPRIAWIDIGGYGLFGEWHVSGVDYSRAPAGIARATTASLIHIVDSHTIAFPDQRLVMMAGGADTAEAFEHAMLAPTLNPVGWRHDCLGLIRDDRGVFVEQIRRYADAAKFPVQHKYIYDQQRWKIAPVVTEYCTPRPDQTSPAGLTAFAAALGQVTDLHVSLVSNGNFAAPWDAFPPEQQADATAVGKAAGYRLVLNRIQLPQTVTPGAPFTIESSWSNLGVAPVYEAWQVILQLRAGTNVAWQGVSGLDLTQLQPAGSGNPPHVQTDVFSLPGLVPGGTYELVVVVHDPIGIRQPLALAIQGEGPDGSYALGAVTVSASP
jgi:hypothetical protein